MIRLIFLSFILAACGSMPKPDSLTDSLDACEYSIDPAHCAETLADRSW